MDNSQRHVLLAIRDQAKLLSNTNQHISTGKWSPQQWWESFQFLFVHSSLPADSLHQDDLLFFVRAGNASSTSRDSALFVRRKAKQLPDELQLSGRDFPNVDWAQTVLLNLVLQSQYQLTVVTCGSEDLAQVAEGRTWTEAIRCVTKPVFATTTVTAVNLDSSRAEASQPRPCYPDICFAVDNFDNAFEDLVLEEPSRCFCVVLHAIIEHRMHAADDSAASACLGVPDSAVGSGVPAVPTVPTAVSTWTEAAAAAAATPDCGNGWSDPGAGGAPAGLEGPTAEPGAAARSGDEGSNGASSEWQIQAHKKRNLFAGYVSYAQILQFLDVCARNKNVFGGVWMGLSSSEQRDKVVMTGPGGVGRCEVAVTKRQRQQPRTAQQQAAQLPQQQQAASSSVAIEAGSGRISDSSSNPEQQQQQQQPPPGSFFQRPLLQRARMLASGLQRALSNAPNEGPSFSLLCALMLMRLPVQYLAHELLEAV